MSVPEWIMFVREAFRGAARTNAVQPILWACAVVTVPCLYFASYTKGWLQIALVVIACVPLSLLVIAYLYFMLKDPDRLHSEDFQTRHRAFDLIESKGGRLNYSADDLLGIANPYQHRLPGPRESDNG